MSEIIRFIIQGTQQDDFDAKKPGIAKNKRVKPLSENSTATLEDSIQGSETEDIILPTSRQLELWPGEVFSKEVIRSEVNFLLLPFFALSRRDTHARLKTEYHTTVKRGEDRLEVSWRVLAHQEYGYPGPFDRRVHKAIEQIISELGLPLENPIRLGSLSNLAKFIGVGISKRGTIPGKTYKEIKESLRRITMTGVESRGAFYHKGGERWIEDAFHLYDRVVFAGELFPNGEVSDTNYLFVSSWYLESVNARYVKPLDYAYFRFLKSHVASRLYELLGVKFYGMGNYPYIRYRYSTLCQLLPVTRQRKASDAKRNLRLAHQELTSTQFFSRVEWENVPGENRDWYVKYFPGNRVGEEIQRFRQYPAPTPDDSDNEVGDSELPPILEDEPPQPAPVGATQPKPRRRKKSQQPELTNTQQQLLSQMAELGVGESAAVTFVQELDPEYIRNWMTFAKEKPDEEFEKGRAAYLVSALRDNWQLPESFYREEEARREVERQKEERRRRDNCSICGGEGFYYVDRNKRTVAICTHTGKKSSFKKADTGHQHYMKPDPREIIPPAPIRGL